LDSSIKDLRGPNHHTQPLCQNHNQIYRTWIYTVSRTIPDRSGCHNIWQDYPRGYCLYAV